MLILILRTDKPEAEVGLFTDKQQLCYDTWVAHRHLAETIHRKIEDLLKGQQKRLEDIEGIVCFTGPGSFTGLRIGLSVANALAASFSLRIVGTNGEAWITDGLHELTAGTTNQAVVLPEYGGPAFTTPPRK